MNLSSNPTFVLYALMSIVLSLNLLVLWAFSGVKRGSTGASPNAEDVTRFGGTLAFTEPPELARVLRAHGNAAANIVPFLILGLVFVLSGGSRTVAAWLFGIFTVARLLHSVAYLNGKQPWRTIAFSIGGLATIALMAAIAWQMLHDPQP